MPNAYFVTEISLDVRPPRPARTRRGWLHVVGICAIFAALPAVYAGLWWAAETALALAPAFR